MVYFMITITNLLEKNIDIESYLSVESGKCVFFDIETTGFSAYNSQLYLIGVVYKNSNGNYEYTQWFADTFSSEVPILEAFFEFIEKYDYLISFNGDGFDIPYLTKKAADFGIVPTFDKITSIDIFKAAKQLKSLLDLDNCKQKCIEAFLSLKRDDKYNGGELIEVYNKYLKSKDKELYKLLILHNEEDIKGMPDILPILTYASLLKDTKLPVSLPSYENISYEIDENNEEIVITARSKKPFPVSKKISSRKWILLISDNTVSIRLRLYNGELKYFFEDYKDYFYLPEEDVALHKSVAQFIDKDRRKKATKATCYTKKTGMFMFQPEVIFEPSLIKEYKDKEYYTPIDNEQLKDAGLMETYIKAFVAYIMKEM